MRLIDVDAFRREFGFAEECRDCKREEKWKCDSQMYSAQDICGWLDETPTVDGWISVKDRLPEPPAQCLVYSDKARRPRGMETATYTNLGWMTAAYFPEITHWMPLPALPEEEN